MQFEELLKQCEELKKLIVILESNQVTEDQKTIKDIQLQYLRECLTEVGRQLNNMKLYKEYP